MTDALLNNGLTNIYICVKGQAESEEALQGQNTSESNIFVDQAPDMQALTETDAVETPQSWNPCKNIIQHVLNVKVHIHTLAAS